MPSFDFKYTLASKLDAVMEALPKEIAAELYPFGEDVMSDSKQVVPVDTGALMNTGRVELPERNGDAITVVLGYGSVSVDYALSVHENLSPHVHWKRPGSGPKYLENPLKAKQGELPERITNRVREVLNR